MCSFRNFVVIIDCVIVCLCQFMCSCNFNSYLRNRQCELEMLIAMKEKGSDEGKCNESIMNSVSEFSEFLEKNRIDLATQELRSLEGANALISKLSAEVEPFRVLTDDTSQWEEKSVAVRFANKIQKHKRNKLWRKRKRKRVAEMIAKVMRVFFDRKFVWILFMPI